MRADKHYYVNADRSRIVERDDPDAAYLLAAEGDDISTEDARKYRLGRYADPEPTVAKADDQSAEAKMVDGPAENKAQKAPAKKDDKDK